MSILIDSPQIKALRKEVEMRVGMINTHDKLSKLETMIEEKCKEHVSITTLQRLWGYSTRNASKVSERVLDIISRFVDAGSWENFCATRSKDSEIFCMEGAIDCIRLAIGTRIRLAWLPDRVCEIEYLGNNRFVAVRSENATIKAGDTFRCLQIEKGRELYMDNFTRCGEAESYGTRYVVGKNNGLTLMQLIENEVTETTE